MVVMLAPIGYAAAVLACAEPGWCWLGGLVGGVITLAPLAFGVHPRIEKAVISAVGIGWLIGLVFVFWIVAFFGGILLWQVCVAFMLSNALHSDDS